MPICRLKNGRTHDRVLPVFYNDNYLSLLPGESKTILIEADSKNLGADKPQVTLDGWNVTVADKGFCRRRRGECGSTNKDAFVGPKSVDSGQNLITWLPHVGNTSPAGDG